ncbi:MAG: Fic family protein, partial [Thermomicrobiales bacterium]
QDGNGRRSRVLTTLLHLQAGYTYVPYSSLESVVEQSKDRYYLALRQTQGTIRSESPDWQPWLMYFVQALQQQMQRLSVKVDRERLLLSALPALSEQILAHARDHGRVTMGDIILTTGASRNTLKEHLRDLVARNQLAQHGTGRGTWYQLP